MKTEGPSRLKSWLPSAAGRERMMASPGEPLFHADWLDVVFLHYAVDPAVLQPQVPWPLDVRDGRAFVSLVAFTMRDMRPRLGGKLGALLFKPIATHEFLNVRTYVRHDGERGIHFLAEWLPNSLAVALGPLVFGLPYRKGSLVYRNDSRDGHVGGEITDARTGTSLTYHADIPRSLIHEPCEAGSLDEFLVERYTAFNRECGIHRCFRIWHPPWPVVAIDAHVEDRGLLARTGEWSRDADFISAHHSAGFPGVWMGRPHLLPTNPHRHEHEIRQRHAH